MGISGTVSGWCGVGPGGLKQKGGSRLTELLAKLGCPDDGLELDLADSVRALVDDLDSIVAELVVPVGQQHTLQLRHVSAVSAAVRRDPDRLVAATHRMSIPSNTSRTPLSQSKAYLGGIDSLIRVVRCSNGELLDEEDEEDEDLSRELLSWSLCLCLCLCPFLSFDLDFFLCLVGSLDELAWALGEDMMSEGEVWVGGAG